MHERHKHLTDLEHDGIIIGLMLLTRELVRDGDQPELFDVCMRLSDEMVPDNLTPEKEAERNAAAIRIRKAFAESTEKRSRLIKALAHLKANLDALPGTTEEAQGDPNLN